MELIKASEQQPDSLEGGESWTSSTNPAYDDFFSDTTPDLESTSQANRGILVYFEVTSSRIDQSLSAAA